MVKWSNGQSRNGQSRKDQMVRVEMIKWSNGQIAGGRRSGVQPITTVRLKVRCTTDVHLIKVEMIK